jgi:hypothetical protein
VTYQAVGLPDGLSVNPSTGLISGTIANGAAATGLFAVTVTANDGSNSSSQQFTWTVNPYVAMQPLADQSNSEGDTVSLQAEASDAGGLTLTWSADSLPDGLSIDASSGLISGTIATGAAGNGPFEVTVTASDGTYSSSQTFAWAVKPAVAPAPPDLSNPGTQVSQTGDEVNLQIQATDSAGYDITYQVERLPAGLDMDPNTGAITGTVDDAASAASYDVTVLAADGVGDTATQTFSWLVNPSPITVQASSFQAVAGTDTGSITVGTFTTPDLDSQDAYFDALISWGDGTTDEGTVSGQDGSFTVTGRHIYEETGSFTTQVTVTNWLSSGSGRGTGTATVPVPQWRLTADLGEGILVGQAASPVVGTLLDSNPEVSAGDFIVRINPGDGSGQQLTGVVTALGSGEWTVSLPDYKYQQAGIYTASLTVTGPDNQQQTATSMVAVGDLYAGIPATLTVAEFGVGDPAADPSDYTAMIDWGDGNSSTGTVSGANGILTVQGNYAYPGDSIEEQSSSYQVSVQLENAGQVVVSASHAVIVVRPPVALQVANVVENADGLSRARRWLCSRSQTEVTRLRSSRQRSSGATAPAARGR